MDLRLHPCSVAPAEGPEKCGPNRPTRCGSSCNNAAFFQRRRSSVFTNVIVRSRAGDRGPWPETVAVLAGGMTTVAPRARAVS